jgi:hypothetical protein
MAVYKYRGRRVPKFKQRAKVKVKEESPSLYRNLVGVVKLITPEESGLVYGIEFDSPPSELANYTVIEEKDLEAAS